MTTGKSTGGAAQLIKPPDFNMTYEKIIEVLKSNHFYPDTVTKDGKITELRVNAPPILMQDRKKRLEEVLADAKVKITTMPNDGYILITKNKKA